MNYDNMSPVIAWMAVALGDKRTFNTTVKKTAQQLDKKLPRPRRHRLK